MTKTKKPERLMGAMERPDSAKARVLDDDEIDKMLAEKDETEGGEDE